MAESVKSENDVDLRKMFCPCPVLMSADANGRCLLADQIIRKC